MRISIHRKYQYDLLVKPLVCVHLKTEQGGQRLFCLWLWGIQVRRWSWGRAARVLEQAQREQATVDQLMNLASEARALRAEAELARFRAEHAEQGARCSAAYEAAKAKRAELWKAGFRPGPTVTPNADAERQRRLADLLVQAADAPMATRPVWPTTGDARVPDRKEPC